PHLRLTPSLPLGHAREGLPPSSPLDPLSHPLCRPPPPRLLYARRHSSPLPQPSLHIHSAIRRGRRRQVPPSPLPRLCGARITLRTAPRPCGRVRGCEILL